MYYINKKVLQLYQFFTNFFEKWFGITNFTLAKISCSIVIILAIFEMIISFLYHKPPSYIFFDTFILILVFVWIYSLIVKMEVNYNLGKFNVNVFLENLYFTRFFFLIYTIFRLIIFYGYINFYLKNFNSLNMDRFHLLIISEILNNLRPLFILNLFYLVICKNKTHPNKNNESLDGDLL